MAFYMISARDKMTGGTQGKLSYLSSPDGDSGYVELDRPIWVAKILEELNDPDNDVSPEILFFVHGFNVSFDAAQQSHRQYQLALEKAHWKGVLISFDWPSDGLAIAYLDDRNNARLTANELVSGGIGLLQSVQEKGCTIPVHVLCHSMGAFVLREAITWAYQDVPSDWRLGQVLMAAPDIEAAKMSAGTPVSEAFVEHCGRITVYLNKYDKALAVSNVKRFDLAPRLGRVGLPDDSPDTMCSVDCNQLFDTVDPGVLQHLDPVATHCFYFGQDVFWQDVVLTLAGGIDRSVFPTRDDEVPFKADRFVMHTEPLSEADYLRKLGQAR
jgi:hypothetical protein